MGNRPAHARKVPPAERAVRILNGFGHLLARASVALSIAALLLAAAPIAADVARDQGDLDKAVFLDTLYKVDEALAATPLSLGEHDEEHGFVDAHEVDDDSLLRTIDRSLDLVPESVLSDFEANGWTFEATATKDLDSYIAIDRAVSSVVGVTSFEAKAIYVRATSSAVITSTAHEFGHYVDERLGWVSLTGDFCSAWLDERDSYEQVAGEYCASMQQEFFASIYNDILLDRRTRRAAAPKSFELVEQAMDRWEQLHGTGGDESEGSGTL